MDKMFDYENDPTAYTFEFDNCTNAGEALDAMCDIVERYGVVSVADLCDYLDEQHPYVATKYGWVDLTGAVIVQTEDAWVLKLPKALPIV